MPQGYSKHPAGPNLDTAPTFARRTDSAVQPDDAQRKAARRRQQCQRSGKGPQSFQEAHHWVFLACDAALPTGRMRTCQELPAAPARVADEAALIGRVPLPEYGCGPDCKQGISVRAPAGRELRSRVPLYILF